MTTATIRDATMADIAFLADSNAAMALETENLVLQRDVLERGIAAVFEQPQRGFYLIAENKGVALGCLLVTHEWSDWRNADWWWLQSVYVVPHARRCGVFQRLHAHVETRARNVAGVAGIRLYVERSNEVAQRVYALTGLHETQYRLLEKPLASSAERLTSAVRYGAGGVSTS